MKFGEALFWVVMLQLDFVGRKGTLWFPLSFLGHKFMKFAMEFFIPYLLASNPILDTT